MIKSLFAYENQIVLMRIMQFLNAFTKDYFGRNYLACESVIKSAMALLKN